MNTAIATDERTIRLILEVTREADDSFSASLEDEHFPEDSDERFVNGISEGYVFTDEIVSEAGQMVAQYLGGEPWTRISKPWEFEPSGE